MFSLPCVSKSTFLLRCSGLRVVWWKSSACPSLIVRPVVSISCQCQVTYVSWIPPSCIMPHWANQVCHYSDKWPGFKAAGTSSTTPGQRDHLLPSLPQNHQRCGLGSHRAYEAAELCPWVVGLTTFLRDHGKGKLINAENVPVLIPLLKSILNYLEGLTVGEQMDC